jgi:hypothetical protein
MNLEQPSAGFGVVLATGKFELGGLRVTAGELTTATTTGSIMDVRRRGLRLWGTVGDTVLGRTKNILVPHGTRGQRSHVGFGKRTEDASSTYKHEQLEAFRVTRLHWIEAAAQHSRH